MLDIGLKFKIFLTLWATFVLTLIASSFVYTNFLNSERLKLVDGQIESYASILSHSDLIYRDFEELDIAEEQIQEILGGYRIGLVLIIKNNRGIGEEKIRDIIVEVYKQQSEDVEVELRIVL